MYRIFIFLFLFISTSYSTAQELEEKHKLHSHNDYLQRVPYWEAYANQMESIEADVILLDGELYVAHEKESIQTNRTLSSLYLDPIRKTFELNFGGAKNFQLLIDLKTEAYPTLKKLEEVLSQYKDLFIGDANTPKVSIVVSGNRPSPRDYRNYPDYILFDYQSVSDTAALPLEKIAMISLNFRKFSTWNGTGRIASQELEAIKNAVKVARSLNKPIRFWATPDGEIAWKTLMDLGVDYINTDHPHEARAFFNRLKKGAPGVGVP